MFASSSSYNPNMSTAAAPSGMPSWGNSSIGASTNSQLQEGPSQNANANKQSLYQSGYLLSQQPNISPQNPGSRGLSESELNVPLVNTKTKMNNSLRSTDYNMIGDSMFQSSTSRHTTPYPTDEDAPPTASVNDIPNEIGRYDPSSSSRSFALGPRSQTTIPTTNPPAGNAFLRSGAFLPASSATMPQSDESGFVYLIVFGYPNDGYKSTLDYFRNSAMCEVSGPLPVSKNGSSGGGEGSIVNAFRIGYKDAGEASRAVRKNGECFSLPGGGGEYMIGVKWDVNAAPLSFAEAAGASSSSGAQPMNVDGSTSTGGLTPMKLAPSSLAFRPKTAPPVTPKPAAGSAGAPAGTPMQGVQSTGGAVAGAGGSATPNKSLIGSVSDILFGW